MAGRSKRFGSIALGLACLAVAGGVAWSLFANRPDSFAGQDTPGNTTASIEPAGNTGPSGLPLPRFVSLKAEKVNVRRGPSSDHPVAWVFQRKGMPVEIVAEFENWRRIRDSEGEEGWILQSMLTGKRTAIVAPWRGHKTTPMHSAPNKDASLSAMLTGGVMGEVGHCDGKWCKLSTGGYEGFVEQAGLWGVYPGELVD
ncbi:MAG: SH3 domain-containing protein [Rhizobiales bacterium]|nr:SH3 domain-containing protein [Hyphomicrobiales bacterium]